MDSVVVIFFEVLGYLFLLVVALLFLCSSYPSMTLSGCSVRVAEFMLTVFSILSCMMRATSDLTLITPYGLSRRGRDFE